LFDDPGTLDDLGKVFSRTIHDRDLEVVDFDEDVVDSESTQRGQADVRPVESITPVRITGRGVTAISD
jgi:hypothetical protein